MSDTASQNAADTTQGGKPAGDAANGAGQQAAPPPANKSYTQAELDAAVERSKKEEREQAEKQAREANLSEQEKLRLRAERAETELRTDLAKDTVLEAAAAAKAKSPAKIYRLYQSEILFDKDGKPSNVAAIIAQAKRDFPDEFGAARGSADGGAGGTASGATGGGMNDFIRRSTGRV